MDQPIDYPLKPSHGNDERKLKPQSRGKITLSKNISLIKAEALEVDFKKDKNQSRNEDSRVSSHQANTPPSLHFNKYYDANDYVEEMPKMTHQPAQKPGEVSRLSNSSNSQNPPEKMVSSLVSDYFA